MKISSIYSFLVASLVCKVLLACFVPVFGDEAYYYVWSLHPQLSYLDHPPMVSWFIYLGHLVLPTGNPFSLRIFFVLSSLLTSILWIKILRMKSFNNTTILMWLVLIFLNPLLGPGSVLATPDAPLVLFWTLSYFSYLKVLNSRSLLWYTLLGVFLGLGFCSKYHVVLFVLVGLIYLLISKKFLLLRVNGILLTVFFGAVFSLPVILWNAQNGWASFLFQIQHGFGESGFDWAWPLGYLLAQTLIINPFVFYSLFKKTFDYTDKVFSLAQISFFFISSFKSVVEGNWPLTSHLHSITHFCNTTSRRIFRCAIIYWALFYISIGLFFIAPATSTTSRAVKKNLVNMSQLNELLPVVEKYQPLYGPSYQVSSLLSWRLQKKIPKLNGLSRLDFYDSLAESAPTAALFYVLKYDISTWPLNYAHYKKIRLQSFDNIGLTLYQFSYE